MLNKEIHSEFIRDILCKQDYLYYLTEPDRMATLFWTVNSLRLLRDPLFDKIRPLVFQYVLSNLQIDGGFSPIKEYSSTVLSTFYALEILYLYNIPYYNKETVEFLISMQNPSGEFKNDKYGEIDTRIDCCAILSLHLLCIMRKHSNESIEYSSIQKSAIEYSHIVKLIKGEDINVELSNDEISLLNCGSGFSKEDLREKIPLDFLKEIKFDLNSSLFHLLSCNNIAFGQIPGSEPHAANTFCVVSALRSLGFLESFDIETAADFLVHRQNKTGGFNGRIGKKEDVCYSFWALASLIMLRSEDINRTDLAQFIYRCQSSKGGFSDRPGNQCDMYHLMFSLTSLSLLGLDDLDEVDPGFAI